MIQWPQWRFQNWSCDSNDSHHTLHVTLIFAFFTSLSSLFVIRFYSYPFTPPRKSPQRNSLDLWKFFCFTHTHTLQIGVEMITLFCLFFSIFSRSSASLSFLLTLHYEYIEKRHLWKKLSLTAMACFFFSSAFFFSHVTHTNIYAL